MRCDMTDIETIIFIKNMAREMVDAMSATVKNGTVEVRKVKFYLKKNGSVIDTVMGEVGDAYDIARMWDKKYHLDGRLLDLGEKEYSVVSDK